MSSRGEFKARYMANLKEKLEKVKNEHLETVVNERIEESNTRRAEKALVLIGGLRAVNRVADNLNAQVISALAEFQQQELYKHFGFDRFADFLDQSEYSPMSKSAFYRQKELYESEGGQIYDTFNSARIPISTRRLLVEGSTKIELDGNELIIGGERVEASNPAAIKDLVLSIAEDLKAERSASAKQQKKIEDLKARVEKGTAENDELRRNIDAMNDQSPYERAFSRTVSALIRTTAEADSLSKADKRSRAADDLRILAGQWFRLRDALGVNVELAPEAAGDDFLDRAIAEIADGDWGEDE